jgi:hypothetical protein
MKKERDDYRKITIGLTTIESWTEWGSSVAGVESALRDTCWKLSVTVNGVQYRTRSFRSEYSRDRARSDEEYRAFRKQHASR